MERPNWAPAQIDLERPSAARIYDYLLGGSHNFAVDRALARTMLEAYPRPRRTPRRTGRSCGGP